MVPPAGGGPTGGWPRVSCSDLAWPGPVRSTPATRRSPTSPAPRPGSRVGPRLLRTGRHHVPQCYGLHEGVLKIIKFINLYKYYLIIAWIYDSFENIFTFNKLSLFRGSENTLLKKIKGTLK
ncbi:hypothetical protein AMECASPLE_039387 [Ameca splendens]|uniref:Uncharacterized protein n=1 Tax=Ameca splendens TaxID=208324 RepID=A0ABV0YKQ8_9TELE